MVANGLDDYPNGTVALERFDQDTTGFQEYFYKLDEEVNNIILSWFLNP